MSGKKISQSIEAGYEASDYQADAYNYLLHSQIHCYQGNTKHRPRIAYWVVGLVTAWLALVLLAVVLNQQLGFQMADAVQMTLLGTTSINVLGLAYIVLNGYFKREGV